MYYDAIFQTTQHILNDNHTRTEHDKENKYM